MEKFQHFTIPTTKTKAVINQSNAFSVRGLQTRSILLICSESDEHLGHG
jgi:hypothetical protein